MLSIYIVCVCFFLAYFLGYEEDEHLECPENLEIIEVKDTSIRIRWDQPVFDDVLNKMYLIKIWSINLMRTYLVPFDIIVAEIPFIPESINFITVAVVHNENSTGFPSHIVQFVAPMILPTAPENVQAYQLGGSSLLLKWDESPSSNGYRIFYSNITSAQTSNAPSIIIDIDDASTVQTKITGIAAGLYNIGICSTNSVGKSQDVIIQKQIETHECSQPSIPSFDWVFLYSNEKEAISGIQRALPTNDLISFEVVDEIKNKATSLSCKITWKPNISENRPGENFCVKYRIKANEEFISTHTEINTDKLIIPDFQRNQIYEVVVTSIDGPFGTDSRMQECYI